MRENVDDNKISRLPPGSLDPDDIAGETVATSAADVASAGRSCMAILVLGVIIVLLVCVWLAYRSVGGAQ
jgi:hypothetical protein